MSIFLSTHNLKIEVIDETFREAIERSVVPVSIDEKMPILIKMVRAGVKKFFLGIGPSDMDMLRECFTMQEKGIIPKDVSFVYIVLLNTWEYTLDKFQSNFSHSELRQLIFSFGMIDLEFEKDLFSFVLNKYEKIGMNRSLTRASILNSFSLDGKKDTEKLENIFEQIKYCIRNGVYTVRINDSTGKLNPDSSLSLFKLLNSTFPEVSFGLHTHNDHGLLSGLDWLDELQLS